MFCFLFHPAFLQVSPLKQVAGECQTLPWWLCFSLLCGALCLAIDVQHKPQHPAAFAAVGHGYFCPCPHKLCQHLSAEVLGMGGGCSPPSHLLLISCQLPKMNHRLSRLGRELPSLSTLFPGAAVFCGFSSACCSLLLVADSRWLSGV